MWHVCLSTCNHIVFIYLFIHYDMDVVGYDFHYM